MNRTTTMKHLLLGAVCLFIPAAQALALPNQPRLEPVVEPSEHGVYSVTDQALGGSDPAAAIAYDNFTLSSGYILSGVSWAGVYAEPLPGARSQTDFIISIWGDSGGAPDLAAGSLMSWSLDGGFAGGSGPDVTVTSNGDFSSPTSTTPGGGEGFDYSASVSGMLSAGQYWISIQADQLFDNVAPVVDPEWQWHIGDGPNDGFYFEDLAINQELVRTIDKDLAFSLQGTIVPEPSSVLLGMVGFFTVGMLRRRR